MKNNEDDIINKIKNQKEEFNKWKNYLASNLSKNIYKKEYLYLIEEEWLRKYQKDILDVEINDKNKAKIIKTYKDYKDINNNKLMDLYSDPASKLTKFKKVSVLNFSTWKSIQKETGNTVPTKLVSMFCNKILIITLLKSNFYCFFFFDLNNQLRQGFVKIFNPIFEDTIINQLQYKSVYFILEYEKEIKKCKYIKEGKLAITNDELKIKVENKFGIIIFSFDKKKEENYTNIINIEKEKEKEQKKNSNIKVINKNNNQSNQNNNQSNQKNQKDLEISEINDKMDNSMKSRKRLNSRYAVPAPATGIYIEINKINESEKENKRKEDEKKRKEFEEKKRKEFEEKKRKELEEKKRKELEEKKRKEEDEKKRKEEEEKKRKE